MDFSVLTSTISSVPIDWFIIAGFAVLAAFDVLRNGASRIGAMALALPVTLLLVSTFPSAAFLDALSSQLATPMLEAVLFVALFIALFVLIRRMDLSYGAEAGLPIAALFAGIAGTAILVVVWLQVPALDTLWQFGPDVRAIFGGQYSFWWLIGSYAAFAFVRS